MSPRASSPRRRPVRGAAPRRVPAEHFPLVLARPARSLVGARPAGGPVPEGVSRLAQPAKRRCATAATAASSIMTFRAVIEGCAAPRAASAGTWITSDMQKVLRRSACARLAHSIETYLGAELVGGLYGVRIGSVFFRRVDVQPRARRLEDRPCAPRADLCAQRHRRHRLPAALKAFEKPRQPPDFPSAIPCLGVHSCRAGGAADAHSGLIDGAHATVLTALSCLARAECSARRNPQGR